MKIDLKRNAERKEKINRQRQAEGITLITSLGFCSVLEESGMSVNKIKKILSAVSVKMSEISEELISNTYTDNNHDKQQLDTEYNREVLERLCKHYGILYSDDLFTVIK